MISEHIVLGPAAASNGLMANPREYALPGNQDPATPWPSSVVLLLAAALAAIPAQAAAGFTTFCIKPSQFTDDPGGVARLCREIMRRADGMLP